MSCNVRQNVSKCYFTLNCLIQFHYDTNEFYEYVYDVDNGGSGSGGGVDGAVIDINADPDVYFDYQANKIIQTNTPRNTLGGIGQQRAAVVTSSAPLRNL